ncbi:MAG TPA: hypothetical protein PKE12_13055 [Kiritimatiellia bacterium]|nr:hypothetical protein [Kiritimatiellia bacterium]
MKTLLAIWTVLFLAVPAPRAEAQPMEVEAMLILASNEPAPLDRRLERVDYILRPLFRFETYRLLGQGSVILNTPGAATVALGDGHVLHLKTGRDRKSRVEVSWQRGDTRYLSTAVALQRGKPAILGGASQGDGKLIVTLTVK